MKTLLEQWNFYNSEIIKREAVFVSENITDNTTQLYQVYTNGKIQVFNIEKIEYCNKKYFKIGENRKRLSKSEVQIIKDFYEKKELLIENIFYYYHYFLDLGGKCSGAFKFTELSKYLTKEQAECKSLELTNKFNLEQGLVDKGTHIRCERCRKITDIKKVVNFHLHSYANYGPKGRIGKFCSGECAGNEQMSLEG